MLKKQYADKMSPSLFKSNIFSHCSFIVPVSLFIIIILFYSDYIPIWDSGWYLTACVLPSMNNPFSLMSYNCANHGSIFFTLLYAALQYLDSGNIFFIHLTSIIFLGTTFYFYYLTLNKVFQNPMWVAIGMAVICFNPAIVANAINPTPDLVVMGLSLICLWGFLSHRLGFTSFFGFLMCFSKESGLLYYGLACVVYFFVFYPNKIKQWKLILKNSLILIWPFFIYIFFLWYKTHIGHEELFFENQAISSLLSHFIDPYSISALTGMLVLNYQWLMTLIIVAGYFLSKNSPSKEIIFVYALTISLGYVLACFPHFTNVRYYLLFFPLFNILFTNALCSFKQVTGITLGALIIFILFASCFRTIDFVSSTLYGTFRFGQHSLLKITSMTDECCGYGRDQLIYNLEHTQYQRLLNQFFRRVKLTENDILVTDPLANHYTYSNIDDHTYHSTFKSKQAHTALIIDNVELLQHTLENKMADRVFFPLFSNTPEDEFKLSILNLFKPTSILEFENQGYTLSFMVLGKPD